MMKKESAAIGGRGMIAWPRWELSQPAVWQLEIAGADPRFLDWSRVNGVTAGFNRMKRALLDE